MASLLLFACPSSEGNSPDAGTKADAGHHNDSGTADAGAGDAGDSDAGVADAGTPPDFTCAGQPLPSTAEASVTLTGTVGTISLPSGNFSALAGATVTAYSLGSGQTLGNVATTTSTGAFSISFMTGGVPVAAYLKAHLDGYLDSALFPAAPVSESQDIKAVTLYTSQILGFFASAAGVNIDVEKGHLFTLLTDCANAPLSGATLDATPPPSALRYLRNSAPSSSATSTDLTGAAVGFNVPAGSVTVKGAWNAVTLREHPVKSFAGTILQTQLRP